MRFYCMVAGNPPNYNILEEKLNSILSNQTEITIVSDGNAHAKEYAKRHHCDLMVFSDGNIREMHGFLSTAPNRGLVVFPNGRGIAQHIETAREFNTPTRKINA